MRNSIQGPLLRTGNNSSFKALGETGYPVFKMAFQLREAIYRLDAGRDLARHLAIPQNDQGGDRTDWYSSFPGDVIPWSGASEAERESARQQFNAFQMAVQSLSEQLLNAEQSGTGETRLTSRMAATFSGGTGSSSQSRPNGSMAFATAMPLAMS